MFCKCSCGAKLTIFFDKMQEGLLLCCRILFASNPTRWERSLGNAKFTRKPNGALQ